ncbi:hypothetical protein M8J76_001009 [Diaphorina citri]|nr:hypothetical protein M8J75_001371 [Diaphorina citri]KAI5736208.1 hypothetical protein M8J76_001009 [Diaphorina citri]
MHLKSHTGNNYECPLCKQKENSKPELYEHYVKRHGVDKSYLAWKESKLYSCPHCMRTYSMEKNMRRHMKLECGKQATQQCPHCPHKTKRKDQLKKHIQVKHFL